MSLRDDASLILIPSAIKDGEVLVQKPLPNKFSDETGNYDGNDPQGSANLTFTRNSNATRVDADGLVEKVRTNSLLQSNQFDTTWTNTSSTETSGQAGYDGSNDAWKIDITAAFGQVIQSVSISGVSCASIYVKAGTLGFVRLRFDAATNAIADFNLSNGSVGYSFGIISASSTAIGGGWYRVSMVSNVSSSTFRIYPIVAANDLTATSGNIYIQDAQLEQGLVPTSYIETTTTAMSEFAGVTASSVADVPRLDYSGGSCPSLLLEPQRTNGLPYSEYFDLYSKNAILSITTNATTSPEGVVNASKLIPNTTNAEHIIYRSGMGGGATANTQSIYAKAGGYNFLVIRFDLPTSRAWFNLSNGTVGTLSAGVTATIQDAGNGWYRCSATLTTTSYGNAVIGLAQTDGAQNFAGNGTDGIYIYGWQSEAGASYPTSLIPSYGTTVTRLADACSKTGISSLIGSDAGTIYLEAAALANDLSERRFALSDGTTSNVARVGFTNVSNRILAVLYNGSNQCVLTYNGGDITEMNKIAFTWATNDFALFVNGVKRASDVSGSTFAPNTLNALHFNEGDGSGNEIEGKFDQVILFTSRLSDTELENLTA